MVTAHEDHSTGRLQRISTYTGTQLLGSFTQAGDCSLRAVSAGASTLFLVSYQDFPQSTGVLALTCHGTVRAEHASLPCARWHASADSSSLLAVSTAGNVLFVCSAAASLQTIGLDRPTAPHLVVPTVSSRSGLAVISLCGPSPEVLFVDLTAQHVQHRQAPPLQQQACYSDILPFQIAQGRHSVALCCGQADAQTRVLATSTPLEAGKQLFRAGMDPV